MRQSWVVPTTRAELEAALAELLAAHERTGNLYADTLAAIRRGLERRVTNSRDTGVAIEALRTPGLLPGVDKPLPWRDIETITGLPKDTAQRWAEPPGGRS